MKIKTYRYLIGALVVAATGAGSMSLASAQSCQELWVERNSYYKDAGYCFKTDRAISYFGNQGCMYYDEARLPLPRGNSRAYCRDHLAGTAQRVQLIVTISYASVWMAIAV